MRGLVVLLALAVTPLMTLAQTGSGTLRGLVTDPDTAIIPGADVTLSPASGKAVTVKSGSDGTYRISAPAGTYTVTVTMPGFATYNHANVKLLDGKVTTLDAKLIVGEQTQIVNVTSDVTTVGVDADSNASATVIKGKDLEALSDDPDELQSELSALAGPAAGPNGGQIYVDGFTGGTLPPKSSIREIRINQNPFSAQYDRLGFGRIEVFTKPGTDKIHGSIGVQGNTGAFNTSNPFLGAANSQPEYHTFFLMGNVSGPLTKTSSYSISGNRRSIQQNSIVNPTAFYTTSATSTTLCPPGTLTGCASYTYPTASRAILQPQDRNEISPRLDFALGAKNVLTVRYQYEGGTTLNSGLSNLGTVLPSAAFNSSSNENEIQVSDTQTVSSRVVNETRFEYQRSTSNTQALSSAPTLNVQGVFTGGGSGGQNSNSVSTHIEVQNYTSMALAKHFIRLGGRLRNNSDTLTSTSGSNGSFTYSYLLDPCTDPTVTTKPSGCVNTTTLCSSANVTGANYVSSYQCGTPSQFRQTAILVPTVQARETDVGLYAEDDWKARPNLTLSAGIRFEVQNRINSTHDFAPRVSLAYGVPRGGGKSPITVVRTGFGIFYDRFGVGNFLDVEQLNPGVQQQRTVSNPGAACQPGNFSGCGATTSGRVTTYSIDPNFRTAYTMQGAFGVDQQLWKVGTVSVNYLLSRGNHEALTRLGVTPTAFNYQYQSTGVFNQQQLTVNANVRYKTLTMFGFYQFGIANSNTSGAGFIPTSTNSRVDYGRASFNNKGFAVVGANWTAPFKITASPFFIGRAGVPYNVTTGLDENGDSVFNDRPAFQPGTSSANCAVASSFVSPAVGTAYNEIPINYCTGPTNYSFNLRLARTFGFGPKLNANNANGASGGGPDGGGRGPGGGGRGPGGGGGGMPGGGGMRGGFGGGGGGGTRTNSRYNLTLGAQAQNLFNQVNYSPAIGTLTNQQFGRFVSLAQRPFSSSNAVRTVTLQMTLNF